MSDVSHLQKSDNKLQFNDESAPAPHYRPHRALDGTHPYSPAPAQDESEEEEEDDDDCDATYGHQHPHAQPGL